MFFTLIQQTCIQQPFLKSFSHQIEPPSHWSLPHWTGGTMPLGCTQVWKGKMCRPSRKNNICSVARAFRTINEIRRHTKAAAPAPPSCFSSRTPSRFLFQLICRHNVDIQQFVGTSFYLFVRMLGHKKPPDGGGPQSRAPAGGGPSSFLLLQLLSLFPLEMRKKMVT